MLAVLGFFLRRLAISIAILLVLTLATFAMFEKIPNEPAGFLVDLKHATPAQVRQARHKLGADKPLPGRGYCNLHGTPQIAYGTPGTVTTQTCGGVRDWALHLLLPWVTFALFFIALYSRVIRSRMMDVLGEPFIRTARAKGAPEWRVVRKHALPNALLPIVTMTAMDIGTALGVAAYVETVFHLPGLGARIVTSIASGLFDVPVVIGIVFFTAVIILALNLVVDLLYAVLDPRVASGRAALGPAARSGRVA